MTRTAPIFSALAFVLAGCPAPVQTVVPTPAAVKSFTASPTQVAPGGRVTLRWEVTDAEEVSLRELTTGPISIDGSALTGSVEVTVNVDSVFNLVARGPGGTDSRFVSVVVTTTEERVLLVATPSEIAAGEPATLVWNAPGAMGITLTEVGGSAVDVGASPGEAGSVVVRPTKTTTYELTAGTRTARAAVAVAPAFLSAEVDKAAALPGETVTLRWMTGGGEKLTITRSGMGTPLLVETDAAKVRSSQLMDTIPATFPSGGALDYRLVLEGGGQTIERTLRVNVGVEPRITAFNVPPTVALRGTFAVNWQTTGANRVEVSIDGRVLYQAPTQAAVNSGSTVIASPTNVSTVVLTAYSALGGRATTSREVEPIGPLALNSFTADKPSIMTGGEPVVLTWSATNARNVTIVETGKYTVHTVTGAAAEMGSVTVYPNTTTAAYVLTAANGVSPQATANAMVTVGTPATFVYSPEPVPAGATVQVVGTQPPGLGTTVSGLPNVVVNAVGDAFIDISTTGTSIAYSGPDTTSKLVTLPEVFSTRIFGTPVSGDRVSISINGWFVFSNTAVGSTTATDDNDLGLPSTVLEPLAIAPYWDDLYDVATSEIYYRLDGAGANRRLIVQWNRVEHDDVATGGSVLTFQAQVSASGKIVFAYETLQGLPAIDGTAGIVSAGEVTALVAPQAAAEGRTFTFFADQSLPAQLVALTVPQPARIPIGSSFIELLAGPQILPPNQFAITEVHPTPAAGVTAGEWIEVENRSMNPIDLNGWTLELDDGGTHVIAGSLVMPAGGRVLLGQSATAGDGLAVDYVYGPGLSLPDTGGSTAISLGGGVYTQLAWSSTQARPGAAIQLDGVGRAGVTYASGVAALECASVTPFGTQGQTGTPKAANGRCPSYVGASIPGRFVPIAGSGTRVVLTTPTEENVQITLPAPVMAGGVRAANITVSTNGYLALKPVPCSTSTNCFNANRTALNPSAAPFGLVAPFWDNVQPNTAGGIFYGRGDPDMMPNSGDEVTVVSWEDFRPSSGTGALNFQVLFFDNGTIEYHYGPMSSTTAGNAAGSSATTWLEEPLGRAAIVVNVNSSTAPGIAPNSGYRFTPTP